MILKNTIKLIAVDARKLLKVCVSVLCVETGEIFETIAAAEKATGIKAGTIGATCLQKRKTTASNGGVWIGSMRSRRSPKSKRIGSKWIKVRCTTIGVVYQLIREAAEIIALDSSSINKVCREKLKKIKGLHFDISSKLT